MSNSTEIKRAEETENRPLPYQMTKAREKMNSYFTNTKNYIEKILKNIPRERLTKFNVLAHYKELMANMTVESERLESFITSLTHGKERNYDFVASEVETIFVKTLSLRTRFMLNVIGPIMLDDQSIKIYQEYYVEKRIQHIADFIQTAINQGIEGPDAYILSEAMYLMLNSFREDILKMHVVIRNMTTEEFSYKHLEEGFKYLLSVVKDFDHMYHNFFRRSAWIPKNVIDRIQAQEQKLRSIEINGVTMITLLRQYKRRKAEFYDIYDNSFLTKTKHISYLQFLTLAEILSITLEELMAYGNKASNLKFYRIKFLGSNQPDPQVVVSFIADESDSVWKSMRDRLTVCRDSLGLTDSDKILYGMSRKHDICQFDARSQYEQKTPLQYFEQVAKKCGEENVLTLERLLDLKEAKFIVTGIMNELSYNLKNYMTQTDENIIPQNLQLDDLIAKETSKEEMNQLLEPNIGEGENFNEISLETVLELVSHPKVNGLPDAGNFLPNFNFELLQEFRSVLSQQSPPRAVIGIKRAKPEYALGLPDQPTNKPPYQEQPELAFFNFQDLMASEDKPKKKIKGKPTDFNVSR